MISNYHTASSGPGEGNYYEYSMAGFDDTPKEQARTTSKSKNSSGSGSSGSGKNKKAAAAVAPKKRGMRGRFFGGRNRKNSSGSNSNSNSSVSSHEGGQSLSYSTGSDVYSLGETTNDSSQFSGILKVLDEEDRKQFLLANGGGSMHSNTRQYYGTKSGLSSANSAGGQSSVGGASLQYSDSDTSYTGRSRASRSQQGSQRSLSSVDYSTDADSHLEGSKLIQMLLDEPTHKPPISDASRNRGRREEEQQNAVMVADSEDEDEDEQPFDMKTEKAKSPKRHHHHHHSRNMAAPSPLSTPVVDSTSTPTKEPSRVGSSSSSSSPSPNHQRSRNKRVAPEDTSANSVTHNRQSKKASKDNQQHGWMMCGMDSLFEDVNAQNVRTFLRPFLCGVI